MRAMLPASDVWEWLVLRLLLSVLVLRAAKLKCFPLSPLLLISFNCAAGRPVCATTTVSAHMC